MAGKDLELASKKKARTRPATSTDVAVRESGTVAAVEQRPSAEVALLSTAVASSIVLPTPDPADDEWGTELNTAILSVAAGVDTVAAQLGTYVAKPATDAVGVLSRASDGTLTWAAGGGGSGAPLQTVGAVVTS